jgi:NADPH-dependent 2,4-dienoyl-CoA reductase/sulfur reductase-like enzyme/rhodanese-related sulfurtransferase
VRTNEKRSHFEYSGKGLPSHSCPVSGRFAFTKSADRKKEQRGRPCHIIQPTRAAQQQQQQANNNIINNIIMKIVIIGGVAGGASCAARARRLDEQAQIVLLQAGPDVSFASCGMVGFDMVVQIHTLQPNTWCGPSHSLLAVFVMQPYFIGGEIQDRHAMAVQTPQSLHARLNLDVRINTRVTQIFTDRQVIVCHNEAKDGETYEESYDQLVLAVGAAPIKPPIPGIDRPGLFSLRNLQDMDAIVAWIDQKKLVHPEMHCVVAGAGFIGIELAEQLIHRNMRVSLVELQNQILGPLDEEMAAILHRDLEAHGVTVIVSDAIQEFVPAPGGDPDVTLVKLRSGRQLDPAHVTILGLGVRPDTAMIKEAGIEVTPRGHIVVDDELHTSAKNVWACGDSVQVKNPVLPGQMWAVPLAGPANRQGRMVADNIYGKGRKFKGTYAVSLVRCFEEYAACAGLNEKMLMAHNIPYATVHMHSNSHAGYYPGAAKVHLKVIFDKDTGKIYGAQAVGRDGIDKRIDVIATAMQGGLLVQDLAELELCYAPPVGSAKDPVNLAGMAAQNIMDGLVSQIEWRDLDKYAHDDKAIVLDVRNTKEVANGPIADTAINVPLNDLRNRLNELPKDKHYIVSCASGQRAYYACRILKQNGFENVDNLGGAYATFHAIHPELA